MNIETQAPNFAKNGGVDRVRLEQAEDLTFY
jgi:hypothetical protein